MFGTNTQLPNRMLSFETAVIKYESIKPVRGRSDQNKRPLARRTNNNLTIRQDSNGDIVVRLYHTDIIRYSSSTAPHIELTPYRSVLTNRVMWSILGPYVNTLWSHRHYLLPDCVTEVGGRYYHTPHCAVVSVADNRWVLEAGSMPFSVPRVNRKEAKEALAESRLREFELWLKAQLRLNIDPRLGDRWRRGAYQHDPSTAVGYLTAGPGQWGELAGRMGQNTSLEAELASLRRAVYAYYNCYDVDEVEYFSSYNELKSAFGRITRASR